MKECHTCPFHAEIQAGKHKNTPWEKTPCSSCPAMDLDSKGHLTQPRALRGRVGQVRLSLDYEDLNLLHHEQLMVNQAVYHESKEKERARAMLLTYADCESPEEISKAITRDLTNNGGLLIRMTGENPSEAFLIAEKLSSIGKLTLFLLIAKITGKNMKEIGDRLNISAANRHAKILSAIHKAAWLPKEVAVRKYRMSSRTRGGPHRKRGLKNQLELDFVATGNR